MYSDIETAVHHAVEKRHLKDGDTVDAKAANAMMQDIYKELKADNNMYLKQNSVSAGEMKGAARELSNELKKYGIEDIQFFDSGKNGKPNDKADKNDTIKVTENSWNPLYQPKTFHIDEKAAPQQVRVEQHKDHTTEGQPAWVRQVKHYNDDPATVPVEGYNNPKPKK